MHRIKTQIVFLMLILGGVWGAGLPASSAAGADEYFEFVVGAVRFDGIKAINQKDLVEGLAVKPPRFWEFWIDSPEINTRDLADDIVRIQQYYQARGYYQAGAEYIMTPTDQNQVTPDEEGPLTVAGPAETDAPLPEYDITFHITEGPPVMVRDIRINCLCAMEPLTDDQIREKILLKTGKIFEADVYDQSKTAIRKLLGNRGYPFAEVSASAIVDLNDHSAMITFDIDADGLYYFGEIRITGHEDYVREKVIRRALTFKSGEKFSTKNLAESRQNLFDLGVFKTAVIRPGDPEPGQNTVPIDIQVKPRKPRSVKLGVGYGTDDGLRLQAAWSYRNLTGRADRLTFRTRRSDILENIYAEYLVPYFLSAQNNLVATAGFDKEEKDYFTIHRTWSEVNFYRKLDEQWFSAIGYSLEDNRPKDIRTEDSDELSDPRDTENYLVSSVKFSIERNTVDNVLNSRKGSAVTISLEDASDYLGSEITYLRPGIEAKAFLPLPWDMVLAGRVDFRTIVETGDTDYIPISRQFFSGGSKSVRGYGFEKLGVVNKDDVIEDICGLSSFVGNIELRFPLINDFGGVVFLDMGALDPDSYRMDVKSLRFSSGLGLRYHTIIGPIQLDFGYQLNPAKSTASDDPLLNNLLDKDRWYIHFNIGQTF